jgi:hypothetical protein
MKRLGNTLLMILIGFQVESCIAPSQNYISQDDFLTENLLISFDNWKNWCISYGSGKYIALFQNDTSEYKNQLIFGEKADSIWIRLTPLDTISNILSIEALRDDSVWNKFYRQMNIEDLKSHIDFVLKYKLQSVCSRENPDRIYFYSDSINLLYLFPPIHSGFGLYKKQINSNWYSQ